MKKRLLLIILLLLSAMLLCLAACVKENLPDINPPDVDPPDVDPPVVEYAYIGGEKLSLDITNLPISGESRFMYLHHTLTDEDIPELSKLTKLVTLFIYYADITNLDFLAFMPDLTTLGIKGCPNLTDVEIVSSLKNIVSLRLHYLPIDDLPFLDQSSLLILEVDGCYGLRDYDFSKLTACSNLNYLSVDGVYVNLESIVPLIEACPSSFALSAENCNIKDLSCLSSIAGKLDFLDISRNGLENEQLLVLENCTKLIVLYIGYNFFTDLTPLINLANLGVLIRIGATDYDGLTLHKEGIPRNFGENDFLDGLPLPKEQWDELYAIVRENDLRYSEENG